MKFRSMIGKFMRDIESAWRSDIDALVIDRLHTRPHLRALTRAAQRGPLVVAGLAAGTLEHALRFLVDGGRADHRGWLLWAVSLVLHAELRAAPCVSCEGRAPLLQSCAACGDTGRGPLRPAFRAVAFDDALRARLIERPQDAERIVADDA